MKIPNKFLIYAIDLDKTLTKQTCWSWDDCINAEPDEEIVRFVNNLYDSHHTVIIYTARKHNLYEPTIRWLNRVGVRYSAVRMEKLVADYYLDDRMLHPKDIKLEKNKGRKKRKP